MLADISHCSHNIFLDCLDQHESLSDLSGTLKVKKHFEIKVNAVLIGKGF